MSDWRIPSALLQGLDLGDRPGHAEGEVLAARVRDGDRVLDPDADLFLEAEELDVAGEDHARGEDLVGAGERPRDIVRRHPDHVVVAAVADDARGKSLANSSEPSVLEHGRDLLRRPA